jgi:hypothetical protein
MTNRRSIARTITHIRLSLSVFNVSINNKRAAAAEKATAVMSESDLNDVDERLF